MDDALNTYTRVIFKFYTQWCRPCRMIEPRLAELESKYPSVKLIRIDVDTEENEYTNLITVVPTFQLWVDGLMEHEIVGTDMKQIEDLFIQGQE